MFLKFAILFSILTIVFCSLSDIKITRSNVDTQTKENVIVEVLNLIENNSNFTSLVDIMYRKYGKAWNSEITSISSTELQLHPEKTSFITITYKEIRITLFRSNLNNPLLTTASVTTSEPTKETFVTPIIEPFGPRCYKEGIIPHPNDRYKYIVCKYIADGSNKGWWMQIIECMPGSWWHQPTLKCIDEEVSPTPTEETKVTKVIDGHCIRCYKEGMIPHPTDRYKYIVCEYIAFGSNKGWWIHIMGCAPGYRWHQPIENCIQDQ